MFESWSVERIKDDTYRTKFIDVPKTIADWLVAHGGIAGRDVLDFGCGEATAALGIALQHGARRVVGIEVHEQIENALPFARTELGLTRLPDNLELVRLDTDSQLNSLGTFDIVYSWSVFEHVRQDMIVDCFKKIRQVLRPAGVMFLQTTPLFYSAEGSQMKPWVPLPWAHLIMQQDLFFEALRKRTSSPDQARHLRWVYETLNRSTAPQMLKAAQQAGFEVIREYKTFDEIAVPDELKEIYSLDVLTTNQLVFLAKHADPLNPVESGEFLPSRRSVKLFGSSSSMADENTQVRGKAESSDSHSENAMGPCRLHMKALDDIWSNRQYERELSYTPYIGLMFQPGSFSDFHAHPDFEEVFRLWTQRDAFRGLDLARIWSLLLNAKHTLSKQEGSIAELGVYQGQSSALLSFYAKKFNRKIYIADTFQGFSELQFEENMGEGKKAAFKDNSLEAARAVVGDYEGNRWVVGVFPQSVTEEMREDRYAFVSIDCDIYEPIAEGLEFFWPRMVSGGMIFVHDYSSGHWPGATRAVDEFCSRNHVAGSLLPDIAGSYVLIRQGDQPRDLKNVDTQQATSLDHENRNISLGGTAEYEFAHARANIAQLKQELSSLHSSRSWHITKPLRILNQRLRKIALSFRIK